MKSGERHEPDIDIVRLSGRASLQQTKPRHSSTFGLKRSRCVNHEHFCRSCGRSLCLKTPIPCRLGVHHDMDSEPNAAFRVRWHQTDQETSHEHFGLERCCLDDPEHFFVTPDGVSDAVASRCASWECRHEADTQQLAHSRTFSYPTEQIPVFKEIWCPCMPFSNI